MSVGEVLTARALLPELRERYPQLRLFLSTTTMTGQQMPRSNLQYVDEVFYFPFDLGFIVNRTLRLVRPRLFIMMETEIWPNLLRACHRAGVKTVLVNGRISVAVVSALPAGPRRSSAASCARRSLLHAERRVGAADHRHRRRPRSACRSPVSLKFDSLEIPRRPSRGPPTAAATACCATSA